MTKLILATIVTIATVTASLAAPQHIWSSSAGYAQDEDARLDHAKGSIQGN